MLSNIKSYKKKHLKQICCQLVKPLHCKHALIATCFSTINMPNIQTIVGQACTSFVCLGCSCSTRNDHDLKSSRSEQGEYVGVGAGRLLKQQQRQLP